MPYFLIGWAFMRAEMLARISFSGGGSGRGGRDDAVAFRDVVVVVVDAISSSSSGPGSTNAITGSIPAL